MDALLDGRGQNHVDRDRLAMLHSMAVSEHFRRLLKRVLQLVVNDDFRAVVGHCREQNDLRN